MPRRSQIQHNLPKYPGRNYGQTDFYILKCLKWQESYLTTYMDELSTKSQSLIDQKRLPVTYRNFRHKSLLRPKSKSPNRQGSQPISYKTNFSQRDKKNLSKYLGEN